MDTLLHWLSATQLPGIGPVTLRRALDYFDGPESFLRASVHDLRAAGLTEKQCASVRAVDQARAERIYQWTQQNHCALVTWSDPAYPPMLREIYAAPPLLYVQGDVRLLSATQLAMVGSRAGSASGLETAYCFARDLSGEGVVITSGLARGIDGACHRGALASGHMGATVAVMGTGLGHIYPAAHRGLHEKILAAGGAIVSELPPDTPPLAANFPLRNRIISGLAFGVLVVEAARRSGSLITARLALEQNREVFAMPGNIHDARVRGLYDGSVYFRTKEFPYFP